MKIDQFNCSRDKSNFIFIMFGLWKPVTPSGEELQASDRRPSWVTAKESLLGTDYLICIHF